MAVETRYVVIRTDRNNEEKEVMTFTDKRAADDYDKMLDMADSMFEVLHSANVELSEEQCEDLSIYLAKQRDEVLFALQAKKRPSSSTKSPKKKEVQADLVEETEVKKPSKSLSETLLAENGKDGNQEVTEAQDDNLIDFVIEKDDAA
jgi:dsDNA-binding SOS-regulon protein